MGVYYPHFNPRTPYGVRRNHQNGISPSSSFQSTHPVWGATLSCSAIVSDKKFQSTHPVWGATTALKACEKYKFISIHAPRMGCDSTRSRYAPMRFYFNPRTPYGVRRYATLRDRRVVVISIHAPRMGCDRLLSPSAHILPEFQSTHPVWGATRQFCSKCVYLKISIHAPRMGCDMISRREEAMAAISIHAPRMGCDFCNINCKSYSSIFQSTHPVWGATAFNGHKVLDVAISIHAPRMGCDLLNLKYIAVVFIISIHAPRMGCDVAGRMTARRSAGFQSTHPVWGATKRANISFASSPNFNPRTPYGVRPCSVFQRTINLPFQSTHPVWGAT